MSALGFATGSPGPGLQARAPFCCYCHSSPKLYLPFRGLQAFDDHAFPSNRRKQRKKKKQKRVFFAPNRSLDAIGQRNGMKMTGSDVTS